MKTLLILFIVALVISSIGFKKYIWFISIGYGLSIAGIAIALGILFFNKLNVYTTILVLLLIIYGLRLGLYLLIREMKSKAYTKIISGDAKKDSEVSIGMKICLWLSVALLYTVEVSPLAFRLIHEDISDICLIIGIIITLMGIVLESYSDYTKSSFKKTQPYRFCDQGIFKLVRCPNYLGELFTWTGVFISGLLIYSNIFEWLLALLSYICIIYIMFSGARRLEIRQNKNYGNDPQYQKYVKSVPILLPFIPLYSVEKYKWLVG